MRSRSLRLTLPLFAAALATAAWLAPRALSSPESGRRPAVFDCEDPPPLPEGTVVVAVVDTGVDGSHPALKGRCLPGVDEAGAVTEGSDIVGHGTAMAGLVCADDENDAYDGICAGVPSVRILPVKVTMGGTKCPPATLALGIQSAIDRGAKVVLVAMGMSFTTEKLEEVMKKAEEKGVLVIAAAGANGGCHDLYPAAHPWAISCTATAPHQEEQPDGTKIVTETLAQPCNRSGKTEILSPARAAVLSADGGYAEIEGTSASAARAAGYAAKLLAKHPDMSAARVREILTLSGKDDRHGNSWVQVPARILYAEAIDRYAKGDDFGDLVLTYCYPEWAKPNQKIRVRGVVRNIGAKPVSGELVLQSWKPVPFKCSAPIPEVAPGASAEVFVEVPGLPNDIIDVDAQIVSKQDENPDNNRLFIAIVPMEEDPSIVLQRISVRGWTRSGEAIVTCVVSNQSPGALDGRIEIPIKDKLYQKEIHIEAGGRSSVEVPAAIPEPDKNFGGAGISILIMRDKVQLEDKTVILWSEESSASTQYADLWATREFIFDAPAFVSKSRADFPVLAFIPEVHSAQLDRVQYYHLEPAGERKKSGVCLEEIFLESLDESVALSYQAPKDSVTETVGGVPLLQFISVPFANELPRFQMPPKVLKHVLIENAAGEEMSPALLPGWIDYDGWSVVFRLPKWTLVSSEGRLPRAGDYAYLRCYSKYYELPFPVSRERFQRLSKSNKGFLHEQEAILRIQLDVELPHLFPNGQYLDTHVHTASEFSRRLVEPRLAFGGPLWMLLRSAQAMGLVGDHTLARARHRLAGGGGGADPWEGGSALHTLITTDHNCFLVDTDIPDAEPYRGTAPGSEIKVLRKFAGAGAGQELALHVPDRFLGAPHALVYRAEPMDGPWHAGHSYKEMIGKWRAFLTGLRKLMENKGVMQFQRVIPTADDFLASFFKGLKYGLGVVGMVAPKGEDELRKALRESLGEALGKEISDPAFKDLIDSWGNRSAKDWGEFLKDAEAITDEVSKTPDENRWDVMTTERQLLDPSNPKSSYIAAHPFLDTKNPGVKDFIHEDVPLAPGSLAWEPDDLPKAANLTTERMRLEDYNGDFPFKGMQIWNEPQYYKAELGDPSELFRTNVWRRGVMKPNETWFDELSFGFHYYLRDMVRPGLLYAMDSSARSDGAKVVFARKAYLFAGSDAHGAFNYTSGHGGTVLGHPTFTKLVTLFGCSHGSVAHTSHFAAARVYAEEPSLDAVVEGRQVCTDGPLCWPALDTDTCFDSDAGIWHDSWRHARFASNDDGQIGGRGAFDGGRTALVRRDCGNAALRFRVAGAGGQGGLPRLCDLFTVSLSDKSLPRETAGMAVPFLEPADEWTPGPWSEMQVRALPGTVTFSEPRALVVAAYTAGTRARRFDVAERRCFSNPIWCSTVEIEIAVKPQVADGVAIVPVGAFKASFTCDTSMFEEAPVVYAKQLNDVGDSVAGTWRLMPVPDQEEGFWRNRGRQVEGKDVRQADCVLKVANVEAIRLAKPWYPVEGVVTFAVMIANPRDAHGNRLNAVANLVEVSVPAGGKPPGDAGTPGDGGTRPGEQTRSGGDTTTVTVKGGEQVTFPKGATIDGKRIPPGAWSVPPEVPEAGIRVLVTCGQTSLTLLLTRSATPDAPSLQRTTGGFTGKVPSSNAGSTSILVKNHADRTATVSEPLMVTGSSCVFLAPGLEPGPCDMVVTQGGASKTFKTEAVAAVLQWDQPDAQVGDVRALSIFLQGASRPVDWRVSGTLTVQNAEIVEADPRLRRESDGSFTATDLPGDAGIVLRARAVQQGKMTATARLEARPAGQ
ncbi:MAG: S8 family serine peptidase [Planctomycetia bacterium]|nr:S8 family serine peptidase [Planctomycetia bacterium]